MAEHIEVFNHRHNWSSPVTENYEFKTDIVTEDENGNMTAYDLKWPGGSK